MTVGRALQSGSHLGAFEIERHLASGGMGDVYVGRDRTTGERVAVKVVTETSPSSLERFQREARLATRLTHPHIVRGIASGQTDDGAFYLAMELLAGSDLATRLHQGGISVADAVRVAIQVCSALEYAHEHKVVHRDLKPENIFLIDGPEPFAKVLDFGIARVGDERVTRTGNIIGTWAYMSPEQARGQRDLDARTDLWSLGVVLYECLARRMPFESESGPGTLFAILMEAPPDLADLNRTLPPALVAAVNRALAKSRDERFPTAAAFRAALEAVDMATLSRASMPSQRPVPIETAATVAGGPAATAPTAMSEESTATAEVRLSAVTFLRSVNDPLAIESVASELQGRAVRLAGDDMLVVFGLDRWIGDEPIRATRLALLCIASAAGAGVATGRMTRGGVRIAGAAVTAAAALARGEGVHVDETTAQTLGDAFEQRSTTPGRTRIAREVPRPLQRTHNAPYATPHLGRDAEVAMLSRTVDRAVDERKPVVAGVIGTPGMGKSRLLYEAAAACGQDGRAMALISVAAESARRDVPFDALASARLRTGEIAFPGLLRRDDERTGDGVAALDRARATLATLLQGYVDAHEVVVVSIDDAQWLDASSRATLRWLVDTAVDLPVALWVAVRSGARDALADISRDATVIELGPLAKSAAERLMAQIAGDVPERVVERAGGHPLFVEELARMCKRRGPAVAATGELPINVEGALLAQYDTLEPADREFLKRAAVFGPAFWIEGVLALGGERASLASVQRQALVVGRSRSRLPALREYAFRSAMVQEVGYGLWTDEQRGRLHARAAEWLEPQNGSTPEELAHHLDVAGDRAGAGRMHAAAAEHAARVADSAATLAHTSRALELSTEPPVRWRALRARDDVLQIDSDRSLQSEGLDEMSALAESLGPGHRAEVAWRTCYFARMVGDREAARREGLRAVDLATAANDARAAGIAHRELAMLFAEASEFDAARTHATAARSFATASGDQWLVARAKATEAYVAIESGRLREALESFLAAADEFGRAGDRRRESGARTNAGLALLQLGRMNEAAREIESSMDAAQRVGNVRSAAVAAHNLGTICRQMGEYARAEQLQARASAAAERLAHTRLIAAVAIERLYLALAQSAPRDTVLELATESERVAGQSGSPALAATAHALAIRARVRQAMDLSVAASALAREPEAKDAGREVERQLACYEALGRTGEYAVNVSNAIQRAVAAANPGDDVESCRRAIRALYLVPAEIP